MLIEWGCTCVEVFFNSDVEGSSYVKIKAWRQLHKNAANNIEQVLEVEPQKAAAVRTPTTHHKNYPS